MSNTPVNHSTIVTPCVGVWIETAALLFPMLQVLRSHPAWVCGLKQIRYMDIQIIRVTPCVGVWIETFDFICWSKPPIVTPCVGVWIETPEYLTYYAVISSHPAWVCGLKPLKREDIMLLFVTPCVGVWIETYWEMISDLENGVTPCVGVWIETLLEWYTTTSKKVTPCVGVWIETLLEWYTTTSKKVTPCVGVWIETMTTQSIIILT